MTVPQAAIEAVKQRWSWKSMHWPDIDTDQITAVLEAAMPHIREQIADDILAVLPVMGAGKDGTSYYLALTQAARIAKKEK